MSEIKDFWDAEHAAQSRLYTRMGIYLASSGLVLNLLVQLGKRAPPGTSCLHYFLYFCISIAGIAVSASLVIIAYAFIPGSYSYPPSATEIRSYYIELESYYRNNPNDTSHLDDDFSKWLTKSYTESTDELHQANTSRSAHLYRSFWLNFIAITLTVVAMIPFLLLRKGPAFQAAWLKSHVDMELIMTENGKSAKDDATEKPETAQSEIPEKPKEPKNRIVREGSLKDKDQK